MEKQKKSSRSLLVKALKSPIFRNLLLFSLMAVAVSIIVLFDPHNVLRSKYFTFLDESRLVRDVLTFLKIKEAFNYGREAWYIFICLVSLLGVLVIGDIFRKLIVNAIVAKKSYDDEHEKKALKKGNLIYFLVLFLIAAVIIGAYFVFGAFKHFDPSAIGWGGVLINLLWFLLYFVIFFVVAAIAFLIVYLAITLVFTIIGFAINCATACYKAIENVRRDGKPEEKKNGGSGSGVGEGTTINVMANTSSFVNAKGKKVPIDPNDMFPSLTGIDIVEGDNIEELPEANVSLEEFVLQFQSFAINKFKIYYELPLIRSFIAGMAVSRLLVLEGLSGTGKSMMPRMFSEFTQCKKFFSPVQATWRDKSDLLGFYSEFTKTFKTTDFLLNLYDANYSRRPNLMVLDEMNISRIEYYFADFLSILEYPPEEWKIKVYEPELNQVLPKKLEGGYVTVPDTTWFIGTANTDDSTFTITDKVYDRAVILNFDDRFAPIKSEYNSDPIPLSSDELVKMFKDAQADPKKGLNEEETNKFLKLCDFVANAFDIRFGNRVMVQINNFVPVYVALGGSKEEALDYMFTTKLLRKLRGVYEDYVKDELLNLTKLMNTLYGKGTFKMSEKFIAKLNKRLV